MFLGKKIALVMVGCLVLGHSNLYGEVLIAEKEVVYQGASESVDDVEVMLIQQLGEIKTYTVDMQNETATVARDGSIAYSAYNGEQLVAPGTYFVTYQKEDGTIRIDQFKIPYPQDGRTTFQVDSQEEVKEVLKYALHQKQEKVAVQLIGSTQTAKELFDNVQTMMESLVSMYPDLSYTAYRISSKGGTNPSFEIEISYALADRDALLMQDMQAEQMVIDIINANIEPNMKDYERQWVLFNVLADKLRYAEDLSVKTNHTMQGALTTGIAVCDGYARSLMYLLNSVGIPTHMQIGYAGGEPHAWNKVEIQGQTYHSDLTWSDQEGDGRSNIYRYFNETDAYMRQTHTWEEDLENPAIHTDYNVLFMPLEITNTHRIANHEAWEILQDTFVIDEEMVSFVFYDTEANKWQVESILNDLVQMLQKQINYRVNERYNTLIIEVQVSN